MPYYYHEPTYYGKILYFSNRKSDLSRVWWYVSIIPALREVEAGGYKFKLSLGNLARMCFKKLKEAEGEGNI